MSPTRPEAAVQSAVLAALSPCRRLIDADVPGELRNVLEDALLTPPALRVPTSVVSRPTWPVR